MTIGFVLLAVLAIAAAYTIYRTAVVVPEQEASVVERFGKYRTTLRSGFHVLVPFADRVSYVHSLKEEMLDVPAQTCFTKDNIAVNVDGVLFYQVLDPHRASYGIGDYETSAAQLAQTTLRSVFGGIDLDETFSGRDSVNAKVVEALDPVVEPWGIKINRYEVRDIVPPRDVQEAMEAQVRAERERRAVETEAEGRAKATRTVADANRDAAIATSEGERKRRENESSGESFAISIVADATAEAIAKVRAQVTQEGGEQAVALRVAEQWVEKWGAIAQESTTLVLPAEFSDVGRMVGGVLATMKGVSQDRS